MNWDAIGAVAELGGAAAVVVTLVYLSTQLKQHANQMRNEGHRDVIESYNLLLRNIVDNDAYPLMLRAATDWNQLSVEEQADANLLYQQQLNHYRLTFKLHQKGAIDRDIFDIYEGLHIRVFANPGLRTWVEEVGALFIEPDLLARISEKVEEAGAQGLSLVDTVSFLDPDKWDSASPG